MSCDRNMNAAAAAGRSAGITRSASLAAHYSARHAAAYEIFDEALSGADVETLQEFLDLTLRGKRPRRKKRTAGKYLAAGLTTGVVLGARRLKARRAAIHPGKVKGVSSEGRWNIDCAGRRD